MSLSASKTNEQNRDWLNLPSDVTVDILERIGVVNILDSAQNVCIAWRKICKENPDMWRVIDIFTDPSWYSKWMCKQAMDRSQGQLVDITIEGYCDDELLSYLANRSGQLRRLEIACRHGSMITSMAGALMKFPFLVELNLYFTELSKRDIEYAGQYCPMLKTLKVNQKSGSLFTYDNKVAIAIGENLHELRHLELIGNSMSNIGLQVILDGCLRLETLDLRKCVNIDLNGAMGENCFERIKNLKLPCDSLKGSPYSYIYDRRAWPIW